MLFLAYKHKTVIKHDSGKEKEGKEIHRVYQEYI